MAYATYEGPYPLAEVEAGPPVQAPVRSLDYKWTVEGPLSTGAIGLTYDDGRVRFPNAA